MDKLEFEYPADFVDEEEVSETHELPPFKASSILYVACVILLLVAFLLPVIEMSSRQQPMEDSFMEMLEWNLFSQTGLFLGAQGLFLFWLGLMVDRRGA